MPIFPTPFLSVWSNQVFAWGGFIGALIVGLAYLVGNANHAKYDPRNARIGYLSIIIAVLFALVGISVVLVPVFIGLALGACVLLYYFFEQLVYKVIIKIIIWRFLINWFLVKVIIRNALVIFGKKVQ